MLGGTSRVGEEIQQAEKDQVGDPGDRKTGAAKRSLGVGDREDRQVIRAVGRSMSALVWEAERCHKKS